VKEAANYSLQTTIITLKMIAEIHNPTLRKCLVVTALLAMPVYLPCAAIWIAMMDGLPAALDAIRKIGKAGEIQQIKRAWMGASKIQPSQTANHDGEEGK
jgi:hypothetical protein